MNDLKYDDIDLKK